MVLHYSVLVEGSLCTDMLQPEEGAVLMLTSTRFIYYPYCWSGAPSISSQNEDMEGLCGGHVAPRALLMSSQLVQTFVLVGHEVDLCF